MLTPIADGVWAYESRVRMLGLGLPARATLLRLAPNQLALHSPLPIDDALAREIDALGDVTLLIAPSSMHWMSVSATLRRYPHARVLASGALERKLAGTPFEPLPAQGALPGSDGALEVQRVAGVPFLNEHVFLHGASRTLVVTDLLFNLHGGCGWYTRTVMGLCGCWKKTAQSPEWRFLVRDRAALAQSVSRVLAWDYERIVVAHGDVVTTHAREQAARALAWMVRGKAPALTRGTRT